MARKPHIPEPTYATEAEIESAIAALTKAELYRLDKYADFRAGALVGAGLGISGADLLQEALSRTLSGARRWSKVVDFAQHLIATIRSISNGEFKRIHGVVFDLSDGSPDGLKLDERDPGEFALSSLIPEPERQVAVREELARIERLFVGDDRASMVMEGLAEGLTGPEIQSYLELSQTEYETIMKRLRRGARREVCDGDAR